MSVGLEVGARDRQGVGAGFSVGNAKKNSRLRRVCPLEIAILPVRMRLLGDGVKCLDLSQIQDSQGGVKLKGGVKQFDIP